MLQRADVWTPQSQHWRLHGKQVLPSTRARTMCRGPRREAGLVSTARQCQRPIRFQFRLESRRARKVRPLIRRPRLPVRLRAPLISGRSWMCGRDIPNRTRSGDGLRGSVEISSRIGTSELRLGTYEPSLNWHRGPWVSGRADGASTPLSTTSALPHTYQSADTSNLTPIARS